MNAFYEPQIVRILVAFEILLAEKGNEDTYTYEDLYSKTFKFGDSSFGFEYKVLQDDDCSHV